MFVCVIVRDIETSTMRRLAPSWAVAPQKKNSSLNTAGPKFFKFLFRLALLHNVRVCHGYGNTWGVQVLRSPNFFSREWKQIETCKLLEETWLFFRLGEAKWQHCTTR